MYNNNVCIYVSTFVGAYIRLCTYVRMYVCMYVHAYIATYILGTMTLYTLLTIKQYALYEYVYLRIYIKILHYRSKKTSMGSIKEKKLLLLWLLQ